MTIHYLLHLNLSQTHRVTLKNLHFCLISTSILQEKGMGFLSLTTYFMFWALFSYSCEFFSVLGLCFVSIIGWGYFFWPCSMHIVAIKNIMLVIHVFVYDSHFGVVCLVCVVLCISCLLKIVTMSLTCDSVVVFDHIALSCACLFIIFAHHMHKCCTCYFTVNLVHVLWMGDILVFISMYTYFID